MIRHHMQWSAWCRSARHLAHTRIWVPLCSLYSSGDGSRSIDEIDGYCFDLVKRHDYESFLSGLLVPKKYRGVYFALRAFNVEIATIKDQVPRSQFQAGRIRFQFWKDVLSQIYSDQQCVAPSINHPIAKALEYYIPRYNLTSRWFERSVEARFKDMLQPADFSSLSDMENYAEFSQSSLLYLMLEAMKIKHEQTEYAASHVGVCHGILVLLKAHTYHASQGLCYFPKEVMVKHGLQESVVLNDPSKRTLEHSAKVKDVVNDIASQAFAHLSRSRTLIKSGLAKDHKYALFPAVGSAIYLHDLEKHDFDLLTLSAVETNYYFLRLQLKMLIYLVRNDI